MSIKLIDGCGLMKQKWQERLYRADDDELRRGYLREGCACLFCDETFDGPLHAQRHVESLHGGVLNALLSLDKSYTGLTEKQRALIGLWHDGLSDAQLASATGCSESTLRNQRFQLRQREREARLFLSALKLSGLSALQRPKRKKDGKGDMARYFQEGRLTAMPKKDSLRAQVMLHFAGLFAPGRRYSDAQVRALIEPIWPDYALVRRYLCDNGLLHRTADGRTYWRDAPESEEPMSIDKKAAKLAYKQSQTPMGVYCVRDGKTGRCLLGASPNVTSVKNHFFFIMRWGNDPIGPFSDPQLRADFADHPDDFTVEVVETVDLTKCQDRAEALSHLEALESIIRARFEGVPQYAPHA